MHTEFLLIKKQLQWLRLYVAISSAGVNTTEDGKAREVLVATLKTYLDK